jgi:hypothetical protein
VARRCAAIGLEHYFPKELGPVPVRVQELRFAEYRDSYFDPVDRQFAGSAYAQMRDHPAMDAKAWLFPPQAAFAVVLVLERETAHTSFERQADDPQTSHTLKTAFDAFGQWTRDLTVGYARFAAAGRRILPDQKETRLRLATRGLINHVDGAYPNAKGGTVPPLSEKDRG